MSVIFNFWLGIVVCFFVILLIVLNIQEKWNIKKYILVFIESKIKLIGLTSLILLSSILLSFTWLFIEKEKEFPNSLEYFKSWLTLLGLLVSSISVIIAVKTSNRTADTNKKNRLDQTIFNLFDINSKIQNKLSEDIYIKLCTTVGYYILDIELRALRGQIFVNNYFKIHEEIILKQLSDIPDNCLGEQFSEVVNGRKQWYKKAVKSRSKNSAKKIWNNLQTNSNANYKKMVKMPKKYEKTDIFTDYLIKEKLFLFDMLIIYQYEDNVMNTPVTYTELQTYLELFFLENYNELGHYFRNFHRILKYLNDNFSDDKKEFNNYIGILRAQLSEEQMLLIYYNATYSKRGMGLCRQLLGSNFFGDTQDFGIDKTVSKNYKGLFYKDPQHIRRRSFLFPQEDIHIMKTIYSDSLDKSSMINLKKMEDEELQEFIKSCFEENLSKSFNNGTKNLSRKINIIKKKEIN
ncbi:putative phage abortive infection protein [Vagococcus carniphilus]|uniref:putative phage abortive infection protein n=1 Tax=Vagococcus carniphilus TaxID=218144 RepID=UPI00288E654C|nr:putative phage abortive infection protein [Vagococcus carniphilus]MDT2864342.1 putative phage abortive infection protein [Vagococcus carniphilus]